MGHAKVPIAAPRRRPVGSRSTAARSASKSRLLVMLRFTGRAFRAWWRLPSLGRTITAVGLFALLALAANGAYQVVRKPTELFFPVSGTLSKTPAETWRSYGSLFREYATATIPPELLAALAQVEAAGNPVARTYWQWHLAWNPFEWYRPASSAVGMYQITDGNFTIARHYCIHDHVVAEAGRWDDLHACWFNALYTRVIPSHAIEMTAALLDVEVAHVIQRQRLPSVPADQRQNLAAILHLCGEGGGDTYVRRGFRARGLRCGDEDAGHYVADVATMKREFASFARER